jgi:hypothetical protein
MPANNTALRLVPKPEAVDYAAADIRDETTQQTIDKLDGILRHAKSIALRLGSSALTLDLAEHMKIVRELEDIAHSIGCNILFHEAEVEVQSPITGPFNELHVEDRFKQLKILSGEQVDNFLMDVCDLPLWKRGEIYVEDRIHKTLTRQFTTPIEGLALDGYSQRGRRVMVFGRSEASIVVPEFEISDMYIVDKVEKQIAQLEAIADKAWADQFTDRQKEIFATFFTFKRNLQKGCLEKMAQDLQVHRHTIRYHTEQIIEITGAKGEIDLMLMALEKRFIDSSAIPRNRTANLSEEQRELLLACKKWDASTGKLAEEMHLHRHSVAYKSAAVLESTGAKTLAEATMMAYIDGLLPRPEHSERA